jgi:hypothetical protein
MIDEQLDIDAELANVPFVDHVFDHSSTKLVSNIV